MEAGDAGRWGPGGAGTGRGSRSVRSEKFSRSPLGSGRNSGHFPLDSTIFV